MFVILCYDVGVKRNAKVKKLTRKYLRPVQKSVCEGYITEKNLNRLCALLKDAIDPAEDAVAVYRFASNTDFEKDAIGLARQNEDFIL